MYNMDRTHPVMHPTRIQFSLAFVFWICSINQIESVTSGPTDKSDVFEYSIYEELPVDSFVGNLLLDAGIIQSTSPRFSFLSNPASDRQYFSIDESTGIIRTAEVIDRDAICRRSGDTCDYYFDVILLPANQFRIFKVKVEILDVNDNAPSFPEPSIVQRVSESADIGSAFAVCTVFDADTKANGLQR